MNNRELKLTIFALLIVLFGSAIGFGLKANHDGIKAKELTAQVEQLTKEVEVLSGDRETFLNFADGMVEFSINTNEYLLCMWKAMRNEIYFSACNDGYELYRDSWNVLYDNDIVDTFVYDM